MSAEPETASLNRRGHNGTSPPRRPTASQEHDRPNGRSWSKLTVTQKPEMELIVVAAGGDVVAGSIIKASSLIPVVMTNAEDPVAAGFVVSLAHTPVSRRTLSTPRAWRCRGSTAVPRRTGSILNS